VLVVAAHPDDVVLGCGGTLARLAGEEAQCLAMVLGVGSTSRFDDPDDVPPDVVKDLRTCSRKAAKTLGIEHLTHCDFPDNRFDAVDLLSLVRVIEKEVVRWEPDVVFTHCGGDLNVDHTLAFRATMIALRPTVETCVRAFYAFEVPSSTEWAFQRFSPPFRPNTFFDITETLDRKIQAMGAFETETRAFPHPRSPEILRSLAFRWGSVAGLRASEAFELIWGRR